MIWIGTSGYNYPEWKGSFYPADLPAANMLPYYAARFPTVESNYTFYRMPSENQVAGWAAQTPSPDELSLKAPRRLTDDYAYFRLRDEGYMPDDVKRWAVTIASQTVDCRDVFVYFKHEEEGKGPEFARLLQEILQNSPMVRKP